MMTTTSILLLLCLALIALGMAAPTFQRIAKAEIPSINLNSHAVERHGALAKLAKERLDKCAPDGIIHLDGVDDYKGFELFTCPMPDTRNSAVMRWAVLVCATNGDCVRSVTAFSARSYSYITNLIQTGKYIPVKE